MVRSSELKAPNFFSENGGIDIAPFVSAKAEIELDLFTSRYENSSNFTSEFFSVSFCQRETGSWGAV